MKIKCKDRSEMNALRRLLVQKGVPESALRAEGLINYILVVDDHYKKEVGQAAEELGGAKSKEQSETQQVQSSMGQLQNAAEQVDNASSLDEEE